MDQSGTLTAALKKELVGYHGRDWRKNILADGEEKYKSYVMDNSTWELDSVSIKELKNTQNPLVINTFGTVEEGIENLGDKIYISPMFDLKETSNDFKTDIRKYPVDFGCKETKTYFAQITIPVGYSLIEKPENKVIELPEKSGRFTYSVLQSGQIITVISKLNINKAMFLQDEYPHLKEFFDIVIAKHAEQLVLQKI